MLVDTGNKIKDPKVDQVVFYQPWMGKTDSRKKPYPVIINSGYYLDPTYQRLSNHWSWQRLTPTGRIQEEEENGYGNFTEAVGWELTRKIKVLPIQLKVEVGSLWDYDRSLCQSQHTIALKVKSVENDSVTFEQDMAYKGYSIEYFNGETFKPHVPKKR